MYQNNKKTPLSQSDTSCGYVRKVWISPNWTPAVNRQPCFRREDSSKLQSPLSHYFLRRKILQQKTKLKKHATQKNVARKSEKSKKKLKNQAPGISRAVVSAMLETLATFWFLNKKIKMGKIEKSQISENPLKMVLKRPPVCHSNFSKLPLRLDAGGKPSTLFPLGGLVKASITLIST